MEENNQEQINVAQNSNVEPKFTPLGQVNETVPKKKKSKVGVVIVILLLLAAIIGGLAYYYFQIYTNPKVVYQQMIKTGINSLTTTTDEKMTTLKAKTKLDVDINLDESYMEEGVEEVIDLINNIDAVLEMQMDINEQKAIVKLDSNYENEELLNLDILMDVENEKGYVKADQFFDKVLEVEEVDFEDLKTSFEEIKEVIENDEPIFGDEITRKKAVGILNKEFAGIIKDEYCSKEKEKITVNGKEINADNYILKMTYTQMIEELSTVLENLKNNEEFLNCFEDKEELKENLEDVLGELEYELEYAEIDEEPTIYIKIYKTGLRQEVIRVDFELEIDGEKLIAKVEKVDDSYAFDVNAADENVCKGTLKLENLDENTIKLNLTFDVEDVVELALNMEYGYTINEAIDAFDIENAVTQDEMTDADMLRLYANLQESKLYELIEEFSNMSGNVDIGGSEIEAPNNEVIETPVNNNETANDIEKNISTNGALTKEGNVIVFIKNDNTVATDIDVEVEFYDANGTFVGSGENYLMAVGAEREAVLEISNTPANFATYKIYVDAEQTEETEYFNQIEVTHNNNGENIAVQVKNNSQSEIENVTVAVVYYNQGEVVGFEDEIEFDIKAGRSGNFNVYFPIDSEYNDVEFDDYKVYVTEAYSYNW